MFTTMQEHGEVYQMKGILELKRLKISHMIIYAHIWIVLRTIYLIIFQMWISGLKSTCKILMSTSIILYAF